MGVLNCYFNFGQVKHLLLFTEAMPMLPVEEWFFGGWWGVLVMLGTRSQRYQRSEAEFPQSCCIVTPCVASTRTACSNVECHLHL